MTILDRYIIKRFLVTFTFTLGLILMIAVVFDLTERLSGFYDTKPAWSDVFFVYYKNFALKYGIMLSSFFTFLSVIIFTSNMAGKTEIVPILTSGVSYFRFLRPYIYGASIIGLVTLFCTQWYLPHVSTDAFEFEQTHVFSRSPSTYSKVHVQMNKQETVTLGSYNTHSFRGNRFSYEKFDGIDMKEKIMADVFRYNKDSLKWEIEGWHSRVFTTDGEIVTSGRKKLITLNLPPEDIVSQVKEASLLDYRQLLDKIESEKAKGASNVQWFEIEFHQRNAAAFSNIILTLIAVSLSAKKTRGGLGVNISIALGMIMMYMLIHKFGVTFAQYSNLNPMIATWLPNIFFAFVALYSLKKAQK
ncbi:MAG: LptF/LptG family permease [Flavobacteriales bacterium]